MKSLRALLLASACAFATPASADYLFTQGTGSTAFDFTCFASKHCFAGVNINSAGTEIMTAANPGQVTGANGTFPVTGTVAATQSGTWNITSITNSLPSGSNIIGKTEILGNSGNILDFLGQNQAGTIGAILTGAQFNTTPTTITSGNFSPLQMDANGNLLVNVKAGAAGNPAAGLTGSAVPGSADYLGINVGGTLRGQTGVNPSGSIFAAQTDLTSMGGTGINSACVAALNSFSTTIPATVCGVFGMYALNATALGRAAATASSPVVLPSLPSTWHLIAANSTNATSVKAGGTVVASCQLGGIGASPGYLKIYNKASAPTVGTDTPVKTLIIPAASTAANGAGSNIEFGAGGLALATGFATAVTGGIADSDTTAVPATTFAINCDYE